MEKMSPDELFNVMSNPNHIFIVKTRFWTAERFIKLGWFLKIVLAIAIIICMYRLGQYDQALGYLNV